MTVKEIIKPAKRIVIGVFAFLLFFSSFLTAQAYVNVKGYYRSDGTYVRPHVRSNPNGVKWDNYSWTPSQGLYNDTYGTRDSYWDTPTYYTDPDYYEGLSLYENNLDSGSSYNLGGTTYYDFGDTSGSAYDLGGTTYFNNHDGTSGSAYKLGDTTYYNWGDDTSGSSYQLGNTTYYDFSDGTTGSSYELGGTTYYDFSDGTSGSSYDLGGTTYYDLDNTSYDWSTYLNSLDHYDGSTNSSSGYDYSNLFNKKTCPSNSTYSDSEDGCYCDEGYQTNTAKDGCVKIPECGTGFVLREGECVSHTKDCQNTYGTNSYGVKGANKGSSSCYCSAGYTWNSDQTNCVKRNTTQSNTLTSYKNCPKGTAYSTNKGKCLTLANKRSRSVILSEERRETEKTGVNESMSNRLLGKILLQVESKGEAWYVNPEDKKRYYLGEPSDALSVMRRLGLGISNIDLEKIPTSDEFRSNMNRNLTDRLKGKILLQVESRGQAWYVNPDDGKRYYMGLPKDAFDLMRSLGLGIANTDLRQIDVESI